MVWHLFLLLLMLGFAPEAIGDVVDHFDPDEACESLGEIAALPVKAGWPVDDERYQVLRTNAQAMKECLLDRVTDITAMPDPRSESTKVDGFVVGDLVWKKEPFSFGHYYSSQLNLTPR